MVKVAKTASKNSPTQRGASINNTFNGKPVTKVVLHSRVNGRKNIAGVVGYKEVAASTGSNLLVKQNNTYLLWDQLSESNA